MAAEGLRLLVTVFTVVPLPARTPTRSAARVAMTTAPLAGAALGAAAAAVLLAGRALVGADPLAAVLAVATLVAATRALHLDGLADTVDGLGAYADRARRLALMREPGVGAFAVATVALVLLADVAALVVTTRAGYGSVSLVTAAATGRLAVTCACVAPVPAARPDGLGALVAGTLRVRDAALAGAALLVAVAGWAALDEEAGWTAALLPVVAVGAGLASAGAVLAAARRRLGGITGDVLGALVEVGTTASLVAFALAVRHLG